MQKLMEDEIQTLQEEKSTIENSYQQLDFLPEWSKNENSSWKTKYTELVDVLKFTLEIDELDGEEKGDDEMQVLHILREIKDLQNGQAEKIKKILKKQKVKRAQEFKGLFNQIEVLEKVICKMEKRQAKGEKLTFENVCAINLNIEDNILAQGRKNNNFSL